MQGYDVVELFNFIGTINQGAGGFAQVSKEVSYTITYDGNGMNGAISNVLINGKAIDENAIYKIAVNDYLAGGGDGYVALTKSLDTFNTSMLMSDVVIEYAQSFGEPISPSLIPKAVYNFLNVVSISFILILPSYITLYDKLSANNISTVA